MKIAPDELKSFFDANTLRSPDAAIGFVLWRLVHRFQREMNRQLAAIDLTHLQFTTLALIGWSNRTGTLETQAELARSFDIEPMQMSQIVRMLEAKGLIIRKAPSAASRLRHAEITRKGLAALAKAMPIALDIQNTMFGAPGRPGGELHKTLLATLTSGERSAKIASRARS
jgi:DNA-binding MarR family transcriptional regulator